MIGGTVDEHTDPADVTAGILQDDVRQRERRVLGRPPPCVRAGRTREGGHREAEVRRIAGVGEDPVRFVGLGRCDGVGRSPRRRRRRPASSLAVCACSAAAAAVSCACCACCAWASTSSARSATSRRRRSTSSTTTARAADSNVGLSNVFQRMNRPSSRRPAATRTAFRQPLREDGLLHERRRSGRRTTITGRVELVLVVDARRAAGPTRAAGTGCDFGWPRQIRSTRLDLDRENVAEPGWRLEAGG